MIRLSFKTHNNHNLTANDSSRRYEISATAVGLGPLEIFTIVSLEPRNSDWLTNGDRIHLCTHHGRYVTAQNGGGSAIGGDPIMADRHETFTIEKLTGSGQIRQRELVTLRTENGQNYLMAVDGGGGVVNARSTNRAEWESFMVEFWNSIPVRLLTERSYYLSAENGGGREITANAGVGNIWETFTLANLSSREGLQHGSRIALQVWNGRFISAEGGGGSNLIANQDRAGRYETFIIEKDGGGEISFGDRVSLRTQNEINYVMAVDGGGGIVQASSTQAREWESFHLESAAATPILFSAAPSVPPTGRRDHPLHLRHPRRTFARKLVCFVIGFRDREVDYLITDQILKSFFFDATESIREWFRKTSFNAIDIMYGGAFAGLTVPWNYVEKSEQEYFTGLLSLTEDRERRVHPGRSFRFRDLDTNHDGVVSGEETFFVVLDCSDNVGGQKRSISFTYDRIRYDGQKLTVGLSSWPQAVRQRRTGRSQLEAIKGTILHELSHILFGLPDRYYSPFPPRGDVVATSEYKGPWETLAIISPEGDLIRSGSRVRLQVPALGDYLVAERSEKRYLDRKGSATDRLGEFIIQRADRMDSDAPIMDGGRIYLKLAVTGRYVMAAQGGGDVVQANAESALTWCLFTVERIDGSGPIRSGEPITLKTSFDNRYRRMFYLVAEPDRRVYDLSAVNRGWWETWTRSPSGDGVGGDYDIMDSDKAGAKLHAAYDRMKLGWIEPRVLTPNHRACYMLHPSIEMPEAFILWDPLFPDEWYMVENRQSREGLDTVPSSGLIISWVNENFSYWNTWHHSTGIGKYPAVISAAAPTAPPNSFIQLVLRRYDFYKRRDSNTAFRSGTHILPRGDGSPSRFRLSVRTLSSDNMSFCIL